MTPDYISPDGSVRLYRADCLEVLPTLEAKSVGLTLTDPPYGIGRDGGRISTSSHGGRKPYEFKGWDGDPPSSDAFSQIFRVSIDQCIWGGNYFAANLPSKMGWLVWDKGQDICSSDCELAFTSRDKALRRKLLNRVELQFDGTQHPTQKPVALMLWCLGFFSDAKSVIDLYCGSGSTGVACVLTGRSFIGIERDPGYFAIAVKRIEQAFADQALFVPPPVETQAVMFEGMK